MTHAVLSYSFEVLLSSWTMNSGNGKESTEYDESYNVTDKV